MTHKEIIDTIDNEILYFINSKNDCQTPNIVNKRHGLCELKYIQSEKAELLYSYSDKNKVTIDNKYKLQLAHIHSEGRRINESEYGITNQGEYEIEGLLIVVCYNHSTLELILNAFESMDFVKLGRFITNSEENAKRYLKVKREDKNYNPETRIFVFNYTYSFL